MTARHRVVVVGGGFGGLAAAKALRRAPVDVTLVDRQVHHLFQPLLYHVATGILSEGNIAPPLRDVLHRQRNTSVVLAEVEGVDLERRAVACSLLDHRREISGRQPDRRRRLRAVVLRPGRVRALRAGPEDDRRRARGARADLRSVRARRVRGRSRAPGRVADVRRRRRRAERGGDGRSDRRAFASQPAFELQAHRHRRRAIVLVDSAPRILPSFDESLSRRAAAKLEQMGVEIRTGALVTGMDAESVQLGGERIPRDYKIWSAGVQASPLGASLATQAGVEPTRSGQVRVEPDCSRPAIPRSSSSAT